MARVAEDDEEVDIPRVPRDNTSIHPSSLLAGHEDEIIQIECITLSECALLDDNNDKTSLMVSRHKSRRARTRHINNAYDCCMSQARTGTLSTGTYSV